MQFISEEIITKTLEQFHNEKQEYINRTVDELREQQPVLLAYLFSDNFKVLNQKEREYLFFLTIVLWNSIRTTNIQFSVLSEQTIGTKEEENWALLSSVSAKRFRDRMDVFFENHPQEDMLAFIEDALIHDEENIVTSEGREPIFVALKTIIDSLIEVAS